MVLYQLNLDVDTFNLKLYDFSVFKAVCVHSECDEVIICVGTRLT